jgi:hypothetical protein
MGFVASCRKFEVEVEDLAGKADINPIEVLKWKLFFLTHLFIELFWMIDVRRVTK